MRRAVRVSFGAFIVSVSQNNFWGQCSLQMCMLWWMNKKELVLDWDVWDTDVLHRMFHGVDVEINSCIPYGWNDSIKVKDQCKLDKKYKDLIREAFSSLPCIMQRNNKARHRNRRDLII